MQRACLLVASGLMAVGAVLHLVVIAAGADGYAMLGAPAGLVALVGTGSLRPALSCVLIAGLLLFGSAYGFSAAGLGPPLPHRRAVLALFAFGLIARGIVLPTIAVVQADLLRGICGRCQDLNGFVLWTSVLCLGVGASYFVGAATAAPVRVP